VRPFEDNRDNLVEMINETFLVGVIIYLFCMSSESKWTETYTEWFMNMLTLNTLVVISTITSKI
jgi:hypothetical protein